MRLSEVARVVPLNFIPHVSVVGDCYGHIMLSRGSQFELMKARNSVVRGLRIGVGPERQ